MSIFHHQAGPTVTPLTVIAPACPAPADHAKPAVERLHRMMTRRLAAAGVGRRGEGR